MGVTRTKGYMVEYVVCTYGLFVVLLLALGGIATVWFHGDPMVMRWLIAITAWTPTYTFLLMFKRLYPNSTVKDFYRRAFFDVKVSARPLSAMTLTQIAIFVSCVYAVSIQKGVPIASMFDLSLPTIASALFFILIQGPAGEETGWRGYLLPAIEEKVGIVKGSLIVSVVWAFWHAPVWFLGSGYRGLALLKYATVFVISITSVGFIIGIYYHRYRNLFVPIWIHFMFNFLGATFTGSMIDLVSWYAVFYGIVAVSLYANVLKGEKRNVRLYGR